LLSEGYGQSASRLLIVLTVQNTPSSAENIFKHQSRSFAWAASFFTAVDQRDVARLYAFCRYVDDLADATASGNQGKLRNVSEILGGVEQAIDGSPEADFLQLSKSRKLPLEPSLELVYALEADCGSRWVADPEELLCFAYGVAGTVGLLMCGLLGAQDPRAAPFAVNLGIALQLTNIARDVAEDAARGRFYLPAIWVSPETVRKALAGDASSIIETDEAVLKTLALARRYYKSAREGLWFLPPRNRRVVFLASVLYEAIGSKLIRKGSGAWKKRAVVSQFAKLALTVAAISRYAWWSRRCWSRSSPPLHDECLHAALSEFSIQVNDTANDLVHSNEKKARQ
jgi:phytoene synthase